VAGKGIPRTGPAVRALCVPAAGGAGGRAAFVVFAVSAFGVGGWDFRIVRVGPLLGLRRHC